MFLSEMLLENISDLLAEKDFYLLRAAHEEVHRMKAMVSNLLDLSKIEAGRIEMEFESVHVPTIFSHVQEVFKSQVNLKFDRFGPDWGGSLYAAFS